MAASALLGAALQTHVPASATGPAAVAGFPPGTGLQGVLAIADDDVWTVGSSSRRAFVRHWDGAVWSRPRCPVGATPDGRTSYSYDVVAGTGADDVWLIGVHTIGSSRTFVNPFFAHWDGTTCSRVPVPAPSDTFYLNDIEAFAPDDVVVAGYTFGAGTGSLRAPLLLHWDGASWSRLPEMDIFGGPGGRIVDIAGTASTDLWASVAVHDSDQSWDGRIFRRVGESWSEVQPPEVDDYGAVLASAGPGRVFALGSEPTGFFARIWRPSPGWRSVSVPGPFLDFGVDDIDAASASDAWAVGYTQQTQTFELRPRALRWDGTAWQVSDPPRPNLRSSELVDVSIAPTGEVWTVGYAIDATSRLVAYVARHADGVWERVV